MFVIQKGSLLSTTATTSQTEMTMANVWPDDGQWHHVVTDLDGDRLQILLDGDVVLDQMAVPAPDVILDQKAVPAPDGSIVELSTAETWDGTIDEVMLFAKGLTNWELLSHTQHTTFQSIEWTRNQLTDTLPEPLILLYRSETDPYGLQRWESYVSNPDPDVVIDSEEHGYTGQEKEADLGLYYYGARYYFPEIGRFLQFDPARFEVSPYLYASNNPIGYYEPDGLSPVSVFVKMASKKGLKYAAKKTLDKSLRRKLKSYSSKKWARTFADDALTLIDLATGQSWWEYGLEFLPYAGDLYGVTKLTEQTRRVWGIVAKFELMADHAAKVVKSKWSNISLSNVSGDGVDILSKVVKKQTQMASI